MPKKKTHEEYVNEVNKINPNIEVIDRYVNTNTKILHHCKIDDCTWYAVPRNILNGKGCPQCGLKSRTKNVLSHIMNMLQNYLSKIQTLKLLDNILAQM